MGNRSGPWQGQCPEVGFSREESAVPDDEKAMTPDELAALLPDPEIELGKDLHRALAGILDGVERCEREGKAENEQEPGEKHGA